MWMWKARDMDEGVSDVSGLQVRQGGLLDAMSRREHKLWIKQDCRIQTWAAVVLLISQTHGRHPPGEA